MAIIDRLRYGFVYISMFFAALLTTLLFKPSSGIGVEKDMVLKSVEVLHDTTEFLITICIGLLATCGFFCKNAFTSFKKQTILVKTLFIGFLAFATGSMILSYFARLDLVSNVTSDGYMYEQLAPYFAYQAITLLVSAVLLFILIVSGTDE